MRTTLKANDEVVVVDWAETGDLFMEDSEDGPRVMRPDHQAVIELVTEAGEVYTLPYNYGTDFDKATRAAERILAEGSVNLDRWNFRRVVYGSDAYVAGGYEGIQLAREKEDARWAA